MKKYFFFDIDGTLLAGIPGRQTLPASTAYTLQELRKQGHFLAIATGRSYAMAVDIMRDLGFHNMVHDGGNGITIDDELIDVKPLDRQDCLKLIAECQAKGFPWSFSPENKAYRLAPDDDFMGATDDSYLHTRVIAGLDPNDYDEIYKVYIACKAPREQELEALKGMPWCRYHEEYFFVEPTNKSEGIIRIMDHLQGSLADVVVFGDDLNDLSMFDERWTCIAMGNGKKELKERADYVTSDILDDGIYRACVHYGWITDERPWEDKDGK